MMAVVGYGSELYVGGAIKTMFSPRLVTLVVMILAAAATRLAPPEFRPWNFTAVGAICLFGGAYFQRTWQAFLVPLVALFASDLILAAIWYGFDSLTQVWMNYVLFALTVLIGITLRNRVSLPGVGVAAVLATAMFFVISNFHAWLAGHALQPLTAGGLAASYIAGIPFAQSMFLGNLFYCAILFGGYELISSHWTVLRRTPVRVRK
jgi:hypothetical protein